MIAWTMFSGGSREAFREAVGQDGGTWARARGWALWRALLVLSGCVGTDEGLAAVHRRVIDEVLADHARQRSPRPTGTPSPGPHTVPRPGRLGQPHAVPRPGSRARGTVGCRRWVRQVRGSSRGCRGGCGRARHRSRRAARCSP
ncbi:hypothetical protein ACFY2J_01990 [Streptomyces collinus]|uniref:hypothetical protein n=1 Tax=Streptomyces collinus TaxID=42684 RepID=UPI0036C029C5